MIHDCVILEMQLVHEFLVNTTYQSPCGVFWIAQWWNLHFNTADIKNFCNSNIQDWTNLLICINRSIWSRILVFSELCAFFTQRCAPSPSVIFVTNCSKKFFQLPLDGRTLLVFEETQSDLLETLIRNCPHSGAFGFLKQVVV